MKVSNIRCFYSARAALYQMLEHGFHFPGYTEQDIRALIDAGDENILLETDSLSLLVPQTDDKDEDGFVFCAKTQAWWRECGEDEDGTGLLRAKLPEESTTARRNGIPFFSPQSEPSS